MSFRSLPFFVFFLLLYAVYASVRRDGQRRWTLLIGSVIFYVWSSAGFFPVMLATAAVNYLVARALDATEDKARRRRLFLFVVTLDLVILGIAKYLCSFVASANDLIQLVGLPFRLPVVDFAFPLGVSFFIFQTLSFTVDVYRRTFKTPTSIIPFLLSLFFFPHLVSGPIVRSNHLVPQFEQIATPEWRQIRLSFLLIGFGLLKKSLADLLGPMASSAFDVPVAPDAAVAWIGALAWAAQLYGDFSGYTDIAVGLAGLLGFTLPGNFNFPYIATSPVDFWNRWHMSLSSWLRDYLYFPIFFRVGGPYLAMVITMMLAGIWHGPRWSYVVFGLYHGLLLSGTNFLGAVVPKRIQDATSSWPITGCKILLTFYLVTMGQVLFRAHSLGAASRLFVALHSSVPKYDRGMRVSLGLVLAALVGFHLLDFLYEKRRGWMERPAILWTTCVICFAVSSALSVIPGSTFIYFRF